MGKKSSVIHLILPTSYVCVSTINARVPEERSHLLLYHWPPNSYPRLRETWRRLLAETLWRSRNFFSFSLSFFYNDNWYFSHWKAGTPWPRQHNQCSSWLRGRGREGEGIRGLSYLISVSTRASVWCKKSTGRCFSPPPPFTTLLHFFSFSHSEVCESLVLPVTLSILFRSSSALKMSIFHFPWNEIRILGVLGWITCLVWQPWPHKGSCFFFFLKVRSSTWR